MKYKLNTKQYNNIMGIPSYFHFLLKNHKSILKQKQYISCDDLFIDANSLIYDSIHELKSFQSNEVVYQKVYEKILVLIEINNPQRKTFVCFDGVPPFPKMIQQRQRRFKSVLTKKILNDTNTTSFNTNHITPGTHFMNHLDEYLENKFKNDRKIVFSGPNEKNEGEHKICNLLRSQKNLYRNKNIVIYGLDADLIMLGLLLIVDDFNVFLYKETKHFQYISQIDPNKHYYFDLNILAKELDTRLENNDMTQSVMDYIFLCFLCGNDFMPHIPAVHIRNDGIHLLIDKYIKLKKPLINTTNKTILWKSFHHFVYHFKEDEENVIKQNIAWKMKTKKYVKTITNEDKLNALPCVDTEKEYYLLHNLNEYNQYILEDTNIEDVCNQYLELLEWTWYYYNGIEKHDLIYYTHSYGPRFSDLIRYIPIFNSHRFVKQGSFENLNVYSQLFFVLPHTNHEEIIPVYKDCCETVYEHMPELKLLNYEFDYFLCKYFWESHLKMGYIDIKKLDYFIKHLNNFS